MLGSYNMEAHLMSINGGDLKAPLIGRRGGDEEIGGGRSSMDSTATPAVASTGKHSLGLGALVFLIYYNVGVPFGDEESVKAAGPFMVSLGFFVILPLMWQLPICLITAELTTTFQDHRGSIAWVSEAFGAEWGFIDAVWSLVTSFLDNALYPLIIADFLGLSGLARWLFVYGCIAALSWAVFRGSAVVASAEELVFAFTMLPIVLMVGLGLFHVDWAAVVTPPAASDVDWKLFIQIMFWTSTYWQKVASVGPDVQDCAKNFPRAMLYAAGMQTAINGTIHLVAAGATDPALYPSWEPGYLRYAADAIAGGKWLGAWLTITAAIANSASFLSEMTVTSQTLIGMSERGLLPKRLLKESPHGTHPYALGLIAVLIAVSQPLDFHALVLVCNFLYTLQTGLELAAFYRLRVALPGLRRPYRVPGGQAGAALVMLLPCLTLLAVTMTVAAPAVFAGSAIAAGTVIAARIMFRRRNLGALATRGEGGTRLAGAGLVWDVKVPRVGEREGRQIGLVGSSGADAQERPGAGGGSDFDLVFGEGGDGAHDPPSSS
ncbi:unnamed protein product [Pylaiella littoralis]